MLECIALAHTLLSFRKSYMQRKSKKKRTEHTHKKNENSLQIVRTHRTHNMLHLLKLYLQPLKDIYVTCILLCDIWKRVSFKNLIFLKIKRKEKKKKKLFIFLHMHNAYAVAVCFDVHSTNKFFFWNSSGLVDGNCFKLKIRTTEIERKRQKRES